MNEKTTPGRKRLSYMLPPLAEAMRLAESLLDTRQALQPPPVKRATPGPARQIVS